MASGVFYKRKVEIVIKLHATDRRTAFLHFFHLVEAGFLSCGSGVST